MKTWVYKHYDAAGVLLYVGISNDPMMRTRTHEKGADWFDEVRRVELQPYDTRDDALRAEADAVLSLAPKYNRSIVVGGKIMRVSFLDKLRQDYLAVRPSVIQLVGALGLKQSAQALDLSEPTVVRIYMSDDTTPLRKSVTKIQNYLRGHQG